MIESNIPYTLIIDENGPNLKYESTIENDIAALLIAQYILTESSKTFKEMKSKATGADKKTYASNIANIGIVLRKLNEMILTLTINYKSVTELVTKNEK